MSQWSSLACHPIVDDDVQSALQIISNLGWATTRTVTSRAHIHTSACSRMRAHTLKLAAAGGSTAQDVPSTKCFFQDNPGLYRHWCYLGFAGALPMTNCFKTFIPASARTRKVGQKQMHCNSSRP